MIRGTIYYFLFAIIVVGLFSACSHNRNEFEEALASNYVSKLVFPADSAVLAVTNDFSAVRFEWWKAQAYKGIKPSYEIVFFKEDGTTSEPLYTIAVTTNKTTISKDQLNEIATKVGIGTDEGAAAVIKWVVRTHYGSESFLSREVFKFVITRPKTERPPTTLFLTGAGTEFGENVGDAMELTKITDSTLVIFSKLISEQPFRLISNTLGDNIRSYSINNNNKLVENGTDSHVMKTGVYDIRINLRSKLAEINEVTNLSLFYVIKGNAMKLDYESRGKWKEICLISFSKQSWGDERRYKFRMTEGSKEKFLENSTDGVLPMKETLITNQQQQIWDGVWSYSTDLKDKWSEVVVDMSSYSHNIREIAEEFSKVGTSWSGLAEKSSSDFLKGYWNYSTHHFNNSISGKINPYDYWPEAHALDVIIDAYLRSGDNKYKQVIYDFYEGVKMKNGNTFKNSYYDDMAWHGLTHLRAFEVTGDTRYEKSDRDLWEWILEGWDNEQGGIKWNDQPGAVPGIPSTGPSTIIAIRRWVKYGNTEVFGGLNDLQWAKRMYEWMREKRYDPATGTVHDGQTNYSLVSSYNAGTFLGSAMELYDLTKEIRYLEDAIKVADWTVENLSVKAPNNKILADWAEQTDHDFNLFKAIFIRYFTRLILNPDLPMEKKNKYIKYIEYNAKVLITYASTTSYNNILIYNYAWYFKPIDSFLRGQISGCTLIESLALLEKKGFL